MSETVRYSEYVDLYISPGGGKKPHYILYHTIRASGGRYIIHNSYWVFHFHLLHATPK